MSFNEETNFVFFFLVDYYNNTMEMALRNVRQEAQITGYY